MAHPHWKRLRAASSFSCCCSSSSSRVFKLSQVPQVPRRRDQRICGRSLATAFAKKSATASSPWDESFCFFGIIRTQVSELRDLELLKRNILCERPGEAKAV